MTRVLVVGPLDADSFADNLVDALRRMGHHALGVGPARPQVRPRRANNLLGLVSERLPALETRLQRRLAAAAEEFSPEVVISVDRTLTREALQRLTAGGARSALWFPDAIHNLGRHDALLAGYDRLFFKNPVLVEQLVNVYGVPASYLPEGANPAWHRPIGDYGTGADVILAGNIHPSRALLLDRLLADGVPLRIFGPPVPKWIDLPRLRAAHTGRTIVREEKSRVFRSARVVLNNLHPAEFAGANCRLFEATAAGAVVLTEWRAGMDELFRKGDEVLAFDSHDELVHRVRTLLEAPEAGRDVADAAAARSAAEHTWDRRLDVLLSAL